MSTSRRTSHPRTCTVDGCDRDALARGWCRAHYNRWTRLGDPVADVPIGGTLADIAARTASGKVGR